MKRRFDGHVGLLQCDGGSEWKGEFPLRARLFCDRFRMARPYKKNEQSFIESFNRTLRKECLGWSRYRPDQLPLLVPRVEAFLNRYHYHRPHLAFDPMKPPLDTPSLVRTYGNIAGTTLSVRVIQSSGAVGKP